MIQQMLAGWSLVPLPLLNPLWTPGSYWFIYCWSLAQRILSIILLVYEMRNINNLKHADDTTLMAESKEALKNLLKVKEESEKASLKVNIQKTNIMASSSITSWQIDGETMETVTDFSFWGSKITEDGDCSHEMKTLAPWKKNYDQPRQHIKKQRDITLPTKVHLVKAMVFPVVMFGCESWTIKKAECQRIDAF